uniref:Uncharacterized protein n=1 Tax=Entomoneis paludosa TaxID=265537 RepID=A0A7S3DXG4_9STRA|mmetsp:Transcript_7612/g.15901  ORF Transcript_7612/g.15901 Transcript_7612/m.15901 type:complete len:335 (+) Transcript_7612:157-1161(+)
MRFPAQFRVGKWFKLLSIVIAVSATFCRTYFKISINNESIVPVPPQQQPNLPDLEGILGPKEIAQLQLDCPSNRIIKVRHDGNKSLVTFEQFIPMVLHAVNNSVHPPFMRPVHELAIAFGNELTGDFSTQPTRKNPPRVKVLKSGFWAEFGVFTGSTLKYASEHVKGTNFSGLMVGFDSFEGLPEHWRQHFPAGEFAKGDGLYNLVREKIPKIVKLYKGWFQNTISTFIEEHPHMPAALIHHDGDLFLSTTITFQMLHDRIVPGTHIIFDELMGYPGYEKHEILAFYLWMILNSETAVMCAMGAMAHFNVKEWMMDSIEHDPRKQSAWFQVMSI